MNNAVAMNLRKRCYDLQKIDGVWFAILKNNKSVNLKNGEGLKVAVKRKAKGFFQEAKAMTLLLDMQNIKEQKGLVYEWEPEPESTHTIPTWCGVYAPNPVKEEIISQWLEQY